MTILVKELYVKSRLLIFKRVICLQQSASFFILCVNRQRGSFRVTLLRSKLYQIETGIV